MGPLYNLTQNVVLNYGGLGQRREGLQLLHDPLGLNFSTAEHVQIGHLLQRNSPHTVLKTIVNIMSIILPA